HEIIIVDLNAKRPHVVSRALLRQTFNGLCFSSGGDMLYAGGGEFDTGHAFRFETGYLTQHREIKVAKEKFIVGGMAACHPHPNSKGSITRLFVAGTWGHAVTILHDDKAEKQGKAIEPKTLDMGKDSYPYACLADPDGKYLYVSLWNKAKVAVIDVAEEK